MEQSSLRAWRKAAGITVVTALLGVTAWTNSSAAPRIRTGNTDSSSGQSDEQKTDPKLLGKLDQILANQQAILSRLDEVMEELKIVKIRATVR